MIIETILESNPNLIERHSDKGVYIRNTVTGAEYESAVDFTNEWRAANGFEPYLYEETDTLIVGSGDEQKP